MPCPIAAREFSQTRVSPRHPPGLYGAHDVESALNVMRTGDRLSPPEPAASQAYGTAHAKALEPYLLAAAMLLLAAGRAARRCGCAVSSPGKMRWLGAAPLLLSCCLFPDAPQPAPTKPRT